MHLKTTLEILALMALLSSCVSLNGYTETKDHLIKMENDINSINITPEHHVSVGTGIYPNSKNYKLNTPLIYLRQSDSIIEHTVEYFTRKRNSKLKLILEEWNTLSIEDTVTFALNTPIRSTEKIEFIYDSLVKKYNTEIGTPMAIEIDTIRTTGYRDSHKWNTTDGKTVYLFELGNSANGFRQVQLASYYD